MSLINTIGYICVKFQKEAIHRYPAAAYDPRLADVSFLSFPHRHMLHFKISIRVFHDDRDIEFILFKRWLESLYSEKILDLDYKSMEMISDDLAQVIHDKYPGRAIGIEVYEDDENGSIKFYQPED